ncbi:DUF3638 family protein [Tetrahymena thermophila SB210]|uniref:ubiquitinyl hydrolase 1 n=1 Tax=Tetrahymena thermophila (strain SB210) TaxID=312017 RepID=A0A1B9C2A8_TETTS|nr:DUF3638 family protein [Tetrahymena thermophila SB210]
MRNQLVNQSFEASLKNNFEELENMFSSTCKTQLKDNILQELFPVNLLLSYFQSRQCQINYQQLNIFQLSDENQNLFQNLIGLFTQWQLSLEEIQKVQYEESLVQYILKLRSQIQNSDQFILPTGFSSIQIKQNNIAHIKMLDDEYKGFYPSCIIIQNNATYQFKNLRIIDPITPYQSSINQINIDKINLGIYIDDVALDSLSQIFLKQLLSIRVFQTHSPYLYEELYEVVLPQLEGNSYIKQNESDFLKLDEKRFQNLSYTLVKKVLYYFIKQQLEENNALKLYNQIILEFEFKVLISLFKLYDEKYNFSFKNQYCDNQSSCILVIENILMSLCERVSSEAALQDDIDKNLLIVKISQIQSEIYKKQESRLLVKKISNIKFNHENFDQYLSKELKDLKMYKNLIHNGQGNYLPTALRNKEIYNHFLIQNKDILQNIKKLSRVLDKLSSQYISIKTTIQILQLIENFVFLFSEFGFKGWCHEIDFKQHRYVIDRLEIYNILLKVSQVYYSCSSIKYKKFFPNDKSEYDPNHFTKFVLTMFSLYAIFQELFKTDESINLDANKFTGSIKFNQSISLKSVLPQLSIPDQKWLQLLHQVQRYFKEESKSKQPILDQYYNQFNDFESQEVRFYINLIQNRGQDISKKLEELLNDNTCNEQQKLYQMIYNLPFLPESFLKFRDISFYARISLLYFEQQPTIYKYTSLYLDYRRYEILLGEKKFSKFSSYKKKRYTDFHLSENDNEENYQQILLPIDTNLQYKTENQIIGQQNEKPEEYTRKQFYSQYFIQLNENLKYIYLLTAIQDQQIQLDKIQEITLVKQIIHKERNACSIALQLNRLNDDKLSVKLIAHLCKIGQDLNEKQSFSKLLFNLVEILNFLYQFVSQNAQKIIRDFFVSTRQQIIQKKENNKNDDFEFQSIQSAVCVLTYQINNHLNSEDLKHILDFRIQIENSYRMNKPLPFAIYYKIMEFILSQKCFFYQIDQNQLKVLKKYITKKQIHEIWKFDQQQKIYQQNQYTFNPIQGRILNNGFPISGLPNLIINSQLFQTFYCGVTILFEYKKSKFLGQEVPSYKSINFKKGKIKIILLNQSQFVIQEKLEGSLEYETLITQNYMDGLPVYIKSNFCFSQSDQIENDYWYLKNKILVKNRQRQLQYEIDLEQNEIYSIKEQLYLMPFTQKLVVESSLYSLFERFESTAFIYTNKTLQRESNLKQILLCRLGISFLYQNGNLLSNDYKDYQISQEQTLQTLQGLQNYLILEKSQNFMDSKESLKKVIISHHPIIKIVDYKIKTDLNKLNFPSYFTYDLNDELGILSCQTVSGNIYLALLYYKQGDLIQDKLTQMNSYENCFHILSKAWQNQEYSDLEFNLLLQFFESNLQYDQDLLEKCKSNQANLKQIFSLEKHGIYTQNINQHAIYLKIMMLFIDSYQIDFMVKACQTKKQIFNFLFENFFNYHFTFYLIYKNKIYSRCLLSESEELKLIECYESYFSKDKLGLTPQNYQKLIKNSKPISVYSYTALDYKTNIKQFNTISYNLEIQMKQFFESSYSNFNDVNIQIGNFIRNWKDSEFSISLFYKIYQNIIFELGYNKEQYQYLLQYWFLKNKNSIPEYNIFILILQSVTQYPNQFKQIEIPWHFGQYQSYQLSNCRFLTKDIPYINFYRGMSYQVSCIRNQILNSIVEKYLNSNLEPCVTCNQINQYSNKIELNNMIERIFKKEDVVAQLRDSDEIIDILVQKRKNYELNQFFQDLSKKFDKLNFIPATISLTNIQNIQLPNPNSQILKNQINDIDLNQNDGNSLLENIWSQNNLNFNQQDIFLELRKFIQKTVEQQQNIQFPFNQLDPNDQNLINQIIKSGYGQNFIEELRTSYQLYSQKPIEHYNLVEDRKLEDLKLYLIQKQGELNEYCKSIFQQIFNNINQLDDQNQSKNNIQLLRICRKQIIPNKYEVFQSISDKNKLYQINPQLPLNLIEDIQSKILSYLEIYTLLQQIKRVLLLIFEFEESSKHQQIEEKDRLLQKLIQNMITQRCYNITKYPEWLLFEFQNNILIREQQKELTLSLFNDNINSIYQLNMGEGKTSVILMLLCQMIADSKNIIRINCMESLYGIMQDILRNKFSNLLIKKIYVLPFSRDIDFTEENILKLEKIFSEIRDQKGLLLMTPEQRQCFQLKNQEILLDYLETNDADNIFDWRQHHFNTSKDKNDNQKSCQKYVLNENQRLLKSVLESLKYINNQDRILNYPDDKNEFFLAVQFQYKQNHYSYFYGFNKYIYSAFQVFKKKSTKLKNMLNQKTNYFNKISENFSYIDILDESDEILRHGKELNYTLGSSMLLDGGSVRWEIPFLIFRQIFYDDEIIQLFQNALQQKPLPIIYNANFKPNSKIGGGICLIRFVDEQYFKDYIKPLLAKKVFNVFKEKFDIRVDEIVNIKEKTIYGNYVDFILGKLIQNETFIYNELSKQGQDILNSFLLAKAWLSHNLFYHVMSYRYRVEYGLSEKRQKEMAIPFKAKDQPSEKSEFSHPDIMIGFTILSYLYNGLTYDQFKSTILKLYHDEREDKNEILQQWVDESKEWIEEYTQNFQIDQPNWLRSFKSFETEDETKMQIAFNCLSRNFKVVKYYLSSFTFPIHVKHYKRRITSNAHSLVSESQTKGFSGTDDKNDSMPETIIPKKIQSQLETNGKLIHILSREINSQYFSKSFKDSKQFLDEVSEFIEKENNCYMLIDAGAVITEMSNLDVAKYLMQKLNHRFQGIVYFSDINNKVEVYLQNSQIIPFSTCYIDARQLFIYLDESHTRGSDFVLPITSIGILTVGKDMNKDKLMQAAMRLRDLDFKQSVVVWGSEEISSRIAKLNNINLDKIKTKHVIIWVTINTIIKNEKDLYPVTLLKFKEQIKNNALQIQKRHLSTPIKSLIFYLENHVHDEIEILYQHSPQLKSTLSIIQEKSEKLINDFVSHIQNDQLDHQLLNYIKAQIKKLNFNDIINKIKGKLPEQIMTYDVNFDCDEENEQEVEEIQQQEQVVKTQTANAQTEKQWDFNLIFENDFITNCLTKKDQYPSLLSIKYHFWFSSFQDLKQIKWNENIYITQNFLLTVNEVANSKTYQNDFYRPIGMFLIHNISQPKIILLSGYEANFIIKILEKKKQEFVCMMHIDDLENDPLITPRNINLAQTENLKNLFMILKLINGQCYFKNEELINLKKCLGLIQEDGLDSDIDKSNKIYEILKQAQLVLNSQFTSQLLEMLSDNNKSDFIEQIEKQFNINLFEQLRNILKNSIFDEFTKSIDLLKIFSCLAAIRGKANQFAQSTLKNMIQIKFEWHI